ncbi:MAG: hypothetical protein Q9162_005663 [Coniocarpon cinnabarinum]
MGHATDQVTKQALSPDQSPKHAADHDKRPLDGVILCCTSIAPEQRDAMWESAREMGAYTRLDLTKEATHLVVGAVDTPKYKYVARERPDMHVLLPSWLEAVREKWMAGEDVDADSLALTHRLPTLWSLEICVTGFNDLQQRTDIHDVVTANGATYHGDLTKVVTHLIAAAPTGKKYEYATQWGIKLVTIEWLQQSLQRGMVLEETLYSPTMPAEERGVGAVKTLQRSYSEKIGPRKRKSGELHSGEPEGKRKLRRTASAKFESQNSGIWDDLSTAETSQAQAGAEWSDVPRETTILRHHVRLNGAEVVEHAQLLERSPSCKSSTFCVVAWDIPYHTLQYQLHNEGLGNLKCKLVTAYWIEKCIKKSELLNSNALPIYRPLRKTVFPELSEWVITPTGFVDLDLLHFSKAVKLTSAKYSEVLNEFTSVLVTGSDVVPGSEKIAFAINNDIPMVPQIWFWTSLENGELQDVDNFLIHRPTHQKKQATTPALPGTSRPRAGEIQRESCERDSSLDAHATKPKPPNGGEECALGLPEESASHLSGPDRRSQPLREMSEAESNSQKQPPFTEQNSAEKKVAARSAGNPSGVSYMYHDEDSTLSMPVDPQKTRAASQKSRGEQQDAIAHAIDHLRAHAHSNSMAASESSPHTRRHRKLGRAQSNPSSIGSRTNSVQLQPHADGIFEEDEDEIFSESRRKREEYMPSQALLYEHEESKLAREKLLRRTITDGSVDEDGMRRVESIGRVTDAIDPKFERKASTRRGAVR